jgi:hypothetical protein
MPETTLAQNLPVSPKNNWISRHWHGDLSFGVSFWINGALVELGLMAVGSYLMAIYPNGMPIEDSLAVIGVTITIIAWITTGIWRSSDKAKRAFWKYAARVMCVVLALNHVSGAVLAVYDAPKAQVSAPTLVPGGALK